MAERPWEFESPLSHRFGQEAWPFTVFPLRLPARRHYDHSRRIARTPRPAPGCVAERHVLIMAARERLAPCRVLSISRYRVHGHDGQVHSAQTRRGSSGSHVPDRRRPRLHVFHAEARRRGRSPAGEEIRRGSPRGRRGVRWQPDRASRGRGPCGLHIGSRRDPSRSGATRRLQRRDGERSHAAPTGGHRARCRGGGASRRRIPRGCSEPGSPSVRPSGRRRDPGEPGGGSPCPERSRAFATSATPPSS